MSVGLSVSLYHVLKSQKNLKSSSAPQALVVFFPGRLIFIHSTALSLYFEAIIRLNLHSYLVVIWSKLGLHGK